MKIKVYCPQNDNLIKRGWKETARPDLAENDAKFNGIVRTHEYEVECPDRIDDRFTTLVRDAAELTDNSFDLVNEDGYIRAHIGHGVESDGIDYDGLCYMVDLLSRMINITR